MTDDVRVIESEYLFRGQVITLRRDVVQIGDGEPTAREIVEHIGAVVVAAVDDQDRIVLVNQYRHPVRARLDELPAGLLDVTDEAPIDAARRELAEEAGLAAEHWHVLVDLYSSPGFCDEAVRVYLARGLSDAARPDGFVVEDEEVSMTVQRLALPEAVHRVLGGTINNSAAVAGILAADKARAAHWDGLRDGEAVWPARDR